MRPTRSWLRELGVVVAFTWAGVIAGWVLFAVRPSYLMGDKSDVLFPLVVGSIAGSFIGLLFVDKILRASPRRNIGAVLRDTGAVLLSVPCTAPGLFAGVALMDAVQPFAAALMLPFIVGACCYLPYVLVAKQNVG